MRGSFIVLILALALTACATGRDTLDVRVSVPENPNTSRAVLIREVADNRVFEVDPRQADIPSLSRGEIDNEELTSRAIARKRNSFGAAMGDIVLPEGRTVADVVREAVTKTLRENGYAVYESSAEAGASAIGLDIGIERFWAWFRPGFARIAMEFATVVNLSPNPVTRAGEMQISGESRVQGQAATLSNWLEAIDAGIAALMADFEAQLRDSP